MARVTVCVFILVLLGVTTTEVSSQPAGEDQAIMQVIVANAEGFYRGRTSADVTFAISVQAVRSGCPLP